MSQREEETSVQSLFAAHSNQRVATYSQVQQLLCSRVLCEQRVRQKKAVQKKFDSSKRTSAVCFFVFSFFRCEGYPGGSHSPS